MNSASQPDSYQAVDYTGVLRRRWPIVLAVTLLCLLGAVAYIVVAPKAYNSSATVYVSPTGADNASQSSSKGQSGSVNVSTEATIVTSGVVAAMAGKTLHSSLTPYQLGKQISVVVPANTQTMKITCTTSTSTGAAACANAFANAYLAHRSDAAKSAIQQQITPLRSQITSLQKTVATLSTKVPTLPANSSQRETAQAQLTTAQGQLSSLNGKVATLESEYAQSNGGSIITKALPQGTPSAPKKSLALPAGLVIGLILGLIAAFVWDRRDKRLHKAGDVERFFGLPVLLDLPQKSLSKQV